MVAGIRTPSPISKLKEEMPEVYEQFAQIAQRLENHYRDMQDMEFTIENGKLFMLQTRNGKRTAAALKIAVDLVDEGMITEQEAVLRVEPKQLDSLLHPQFDAAALKAAEVIGKGLAASPGAACGQVVFTADEAKEAVESGKMPKVILVRLETSPEDIEGMQAAQGILTVRRYDQPRRCGSPRHGHVLRVWLRRDCGGLRQEVLHPCRQNLPRGRLDFHRRLYGQHLWRGHPHHRGFHLRRFRALHEVG